MSAWQNFAMGWLVADNRVLATVEFADTWQTRVRGLVGREQLEGALVLRPARSVHTFGVRFPIDVAFVDSDMVVLDVVTMAQNRVGKPRWRSVMVIEAPKASFERWGVSIGDQLELRQ